MFNLCSLLPAQPSQTTHGQWIRSSLSPSIPSPARSAYLFPPPFYGLVYTFCSWCAGQHGQLVRGASWALGKLKQKLQLKWGWRASPHWCDNTQKTAFKVGIKGSLLHAKRSLNPPPADGRAMGTGEEKPLPVPRLGHCHGTGNICTGKRSLQGLTHNAVSVTDFIQERLRFSCVCRILFPSPFLASATKLAATCETAPLCRGVCPHSE